MIFLKSALLVGPSNVVVGFQAFTLPPFKSILHTAANSFWYLVSFSKTVWVITSQWLFVPFRMKSMLSFMTFKIFPRHLLCISRGSMVYSIRKSSPRPWVQILASLFSCASDKLCYFCGSVTSSVNWGS